MFLELAVLEPEEIGDRQPRIARPAHDMGVRRHEIAVDERALHHLFRIRGFDPDPGQEILQRLHARRRQQAVLDIIRRDVRIDRVRIHRD